VGVRTGACCCFAVLCSGMFDASRQALCRIEAGAARLVPVGGWPLFSDLSLSASRFSQRPHPLRRRGCWLARSSRRRPQAEAEALWLQWDGSLHRSKARARCEAMNMSEAPMRRGNEPSANDPCPGQNCSSLPAPPGPLYARSFKLSSPVLVDFVGRSASCILFFHSRTPQRACTSLLHPVHPIAVQLHTLLNLP
jgi:hypothetical protein